MIFQKYTVLLLLTLCKDGIKGDVLLFSITNPNRQYSANHLYTRIFKFYKLQVIQIVIDRY